MHNIQFQLAQRTQNKIVLNRMQTKFTLITSINSHLLQLLNIYLTNLFYVAAFNTAGFHFF